MIDVTPKGYRVLVEQIENRQLGTIAMPDNSTQAGVNRFRVVAIGDAKILPSGERVPIDLQLGDEIIFDVKGCAPCGPAYIFGGRNLAIVEVDKVLGVFTGEPGLPPPKILEAKRKVPVLQ